MYTADAATELAPSPSDNKPKVAILMGTFNGQRFLPEQLDSIKHQTHTNWELHVSDDGSSDNTLGIINSIQKEWSDHKVTLRQGPQKGFVANFLSLACDPSIKADYYAFSDQDDVWATGKLERAIHLMNTEPTARPAMYCSRTQLINEAGNPIGASPLFKRNPSFQNALVQSIAGANTMVFNQSARELIGKCGWETPVVSHDWWVYMLVTGCGGKVFYDPTPTTGYRQHDKNLVGSNVGWGARKRRIIASFRGRFTKWNNINLAALKRIEPSLTSQHQSALEEFSILRDRNLFSRIFHVAQTGLYRQTFLGNVSLFIAAALKKL